MLLHYGYLASKPKLYEDSQQIQHYSNSMYKVANLFHLTCINLFHPNLLQLQVYAESAYLYILNFGMLEKHQALYCLLHDKWSTNQQQDEVIYFRVNLYILHTNLFLASTSFC